MKKVVSIPNFEKNVKKHKKTQNFLHADLNSDLLGESQLLYPLGRWLEIKMHWSQKILPPLLNKQY